MVSDRITCFCPECRASYRVRTSAIGHHARCPACGKTFRVGERPRPVSHPPTEDDILRWLREADDSDDFAEEQSQDVAEDSAAGVAQVAAPPSPPDPGELPASRAARASHESAATP